MRRYRWGFALSHFLVDCLAAGSPRPGCHVSLCTGLYLERVSVGFVPIQCKFTNPAIGNCRTECHARPAVVEYVCVDSDHDCSCDCDRHCPGKIYYPRVAHWCGQRLTTLMTTDSMPRVLQSAFERRLPPKIDYGIAFIGCGGIVNYGHIPSYRASGFRMIGGYDLNKEVAEKTVEKHG